MTHHSAGDTPKKQTFLQLQSLSFSYQHKHTVKNINLTLFSGELLAIVGPNGAGKSTLLRLMAGLLTPHTGQLLLHGRPLSAYAPQERAQSLTFVPQEHNILFPYQVLELVLMGRLPHQKNLAFASAHDRQRAYDALRRVGLAAHTSQPVSTLSGGERQRVMLARALVQETPLLLLDEPTAHLDLGAQAEILSLLRTQTQQQNSTVVVVLHDLNLAALYATRICLLVDGEIRVDGPVEEALSPTQISSLYGQSLYPLTHPLHHVPAVLPKRP